MSDFQSTVTEWMTLYASSTLSSQTQHKRLYDELSQLQQSSGTTGSATELEDHIFKLIDAYAAIHGYNVEVRQYQDDCYERVKEAKTKTASDIAVRAEMEVISNELQETIASDLPVLEANK